MCCQICGCLSPRPLYRCRDTNQNVSGEWTLIQCPRCKLGWIDPFPESLEIESFYSENRFYNNQGRRFNVVVESARSMLGYLRAYKFKKGSKLKEGRVLDFGSGAGHFGKALSFFGFSVVNLDPYSEKSDICDGGELTEDGLKLNFPDACFDAVTLWFVIEHLRDPNQVLAEIKRILKVGGVLFLAQQNFASVQARYFKDRWLILDVPRHLFQFSPDNLITLCKKHGFGHKSVTYDSLEMAPFTILQSLLNCLLGNNNYLFKLLKNRAIQKTSSGKIPLVMAVLSIVLGVVLLPISFGLYFISLMFKSGDVFNLFVQKET